MEEDKVAHPDPRGKPTRRAISVAVGAPGDSGRILAVRRPPDDPDLPGLWGLPAGRIRPNESPEDAVRRAGREKLGVTLGRIALRRAGALERADYRLQMELFDAVLEEGEPSVPQPTEGMTQYVQWRWADPTILEPAADRGSLCCRLYLGRPVEPADGGAPSSA